MCTYILLRDVLGPGTFAFAGNRDERVARPFEDPAIVGGVLMPRDHLGGTWIGMTRTFMAALTNAPGSPGVEPTRSRGLLVRDALAAGSIARGLEAVGDALAADRYDGFNLVLAERDRAVLVGHGAIAEIRPPVADVPPGAHVLEHRAAGLRAFDGASIDASAGPEEAVLRLARDVLGSHATLPATGHPPCRHEGERGTVATMLAFLGDSPSFSYSRGPACEARFARLALPEA